MDDYNVRYKTAREDLLNKTRQLCKPAAVRALKSSIEFLHKEKIANHEIYDELYRCFAVKIFSIFAEEEYSYISADINKLADQVYSDYSLSVTKNEGTA